MTRTLLCLSCLSILATAGCGGDECDSSKHASRCDGDNFTYCHTTGGPFVSRDVLTTVDCGAQGQRCVDRDYLYADCVDATLTPCDFASTRCSTDGLAIELCTLGYVSSTACETGERCIDSDQRTECVTPTGQRCTGTGKLCSADGRRLQICHDGWVYDERSCRDGQVCSASGDEAHCVTAVGAESESAAK